MYRGHDPKLMKVVFGDHEIPEDGLEPVTPKEWARTSKRRFVRGLDLLTFDESPKAKGRRLTAVEALEAYGYDKLLEVATDGSAIISESVEAAGRALRERRDQLNLGLQHVASEANLSPNVLEALEASRRRPVREYERVARVLGLDERMLSLRSDPGGNQGVALRLRKLSDDRGTLTGSVVVAFAEAAWVAMTQVRLEAELARARPSQSVKFEEDPFYGSVDYPAHKVGYDLADTFRSKLGLGQDPIPSMRDLLERQLGIPLIQTELGNKIAGATIETGGKRAIVVNLSGRNKNPFVRRATLAHELCHILFDPTQQLHSLRVDEYDDLDKRADQVTDPVEQRANAFAVQLLAPQAEALTLYDSSYDDPLAHVIDHFGVSFTAARFQIWNAMRGRRSSAPPLESLTTDSHRPQPDWEGREGYTTTYHPIRSLVDHSSRAGRFSAVVVRSAEHGDISWDTASEWLFCTEEELRQRAKSIVDLYPDLAGSPSS